LIQRLQSIFLALSILTTGGAFFTPIYDRAMEDPQVWIGYGLAISLTIAMILTLVSIFFFKNRSTQMMWVKRAMIIQIISLGFCIGILFSLGGIGLYLWDETLGTGLVFLGFILQMLGLNFINKDEKLVRSMDRIR
jgi:predicted small integral membrane protein